MRVGFAVLPLLASGLSVACARSVVLDGGTGVDAGADAGPSHVDRVLALLEEFSEVMCRRDLECQSASLERQPDWECHPENRSPSDRTEEWLRDGRLEIDEEGLAACLAIFRDGVGCITEWGACEPYSRLTDAEGAPCTSLESACDYESLYCDRTTCTCAPQLDVGSPCTESVECGPSMWCDPETSRCELWGVGAPCTDRCLGVNGVTYYCVDGTCGTEPPDAVGAPCFEGECAPSLRCMYVEGESRCELPRREGEDCWYDDCADGLECVDYVCAPPPGEGEPCDVLVDCAEGLFCVEPDRFEPGRCLADATGHACNVTPYSPGVCPDGWVCRLDPDAPPDAFDNGRCEVAPPVGLGGACFSPVQCPLRARCEEGVCVHIVLPDEPCGPDAVCPGSHACVAGRCEPRPLRGEPCDDLRACWDGVCLDGLCGRLPQGAACDSYLECEGYCDLAVDVCRSLGAPGSPCDYDFECAVGSYCAGAHRSGPGVCTANECA